MSISNLLVPNDLDVYVDTYKSITAKQLPGGFFSDCNRNGPFTASGTLTPGQIVNSLLVCVPATPGTTITLTLPNVADVLALLPLSAHFVGCQFTILLRVDGASSSVKLANSANGSCILAHGVDIQVTSATTNSATRLCYCMITSLTGAGQITVY